MEIADQRRVGGAGPAMQAPGIEARRSNTWRQTGQLLKILQRYVAAALGETPGSIDA